MKNKTGYLNEDFKLFHIKDKSNLDFNFHYHNFNKIIIFISGDVIYNIEGKSYILKPFDILLVNSGDVHKPIINPAYTYERIIIWSSPEFIERHSYNNCDLSSCFKLSKEQSFSLIRLEHKLKDKLIEIIQNLEDSINNNEFGNKIMSNSFFLQFLIYINRIYIENKFLYDENSYKFDAQIQMIIKYINQNLNSDLSIDSLAQKYYMSKYYLMHKFKKNTGVTLHNYILQKKLDLAKELIEKGTPIIQASKECGFNDYSSFLRAFKKNFSYSPKFFQSAQS